MPVSLTRVRSRAGHKLSDLRQIGPMMRSIHTHNVGQIVGFPKAATVTISPNPGGKTDAGIEMRVTSVADEQVARIQVIGTKITCSFCSTPKLDVSWCAHIQRLAATGEDVGVLASALGDVLDLPMIPTDGIYVRFIIGRSERYHEIRLAVPALDGSETKEVTIGIARPGMYGLRHVRAWYYDWITGTIEDRRYHHAGETPRGPVGVTAGDGSEVSISPLGARIYQAAFGKMIGDIEAEASLAKDAPSWP